MTKKGFTLIELLVVVAVLALLASIVFSNLGGAREGAKISNALSFQSQTHSLLGSDLVGWWNFNEGDARDISGYGNHGTINGATITDGVPGTMGNAMNFDGGSNYVRNNDFYLGNNPIFTVSLWVKKTGPMNGTGAWGIGGGGQTNRTISGYNNVGENVGIDLWGTATFYVNHEYPLNEWVHVTWVKKGLLFSVSTIDIHVNGVKGNLLVSRGSSHTPDLTGGITMGAIQPASQYSAEAVVDDVRVYSRALSAQEIEILYAQTKEKYLVQDH